MRRLRSPLALTTLVLAALLGFGARAEVEHRMRVELQPQRHWLSVSDRIDRPDGGTGPIRFALHPGLSPRVVEADARLTRLAEADPERLPGGPAVEHYSVQPPPGSTGFTLSYAGRIHHPVESLGREYARAFSASPGLIDPRGVFLAGSSYWYPVIDRAPVRFELEVGLPAGWRSMSQGRRLAQATGAGRETWRSDTPQEEIYLLAGPWQEYAERSAQLESLVLLREPDADLARRYLEVTGQYVRMYSDLIGPYPYPKFALVENFWETGYGMPSFTLLGPRVIRFPFILHSSYPHEILHNWWGNGVYVDYATGNWSEGLTAYLADHLVKEQRGQGADYRRGSLQSYADYVAGARDFALSEFRGRHDAASEAVGYGKTMMVFHMLRGELGDADFVAGLRRLYAEQRFRVAGYAQVEAAFAAAAGRPLREFFAQWVERPGAPALSLGAAAAEGPDGHRLSLTLEQVQAGPAYSLQVPVAIRLQGVEAPHLARLAMDSRRQRFALDLPARPLALQVDPEFDLFRRLDPRELPPALSQVFGAERALILLPADAPAALSEAYRRLAESWQRGREGELSIGRDSEFDTLPTDRAVWLFGWENRHRALLAEALREHPYADRGEVLRLAGEAAVSRSGHSAVVVARNPGEPRRSVAWLASDRAAALPGLGRKLPHYGKYSYLAFTGDAPDNQIKGQWPVVDSPLVKALSADATAAPADALAPRRALAQLPPRYSAARMLADIEALSGEAMEGRGLGSPGLDRAADYIAEAFRAAGLQPGGDHALGYLQVWAEPVEGLGASVPLRNVIGYIPGSHPQLADQAVVLGAHYDHLGRGWPDVHRGDEGRLHPGADDNASGVAVMLELARVLGQGWRPDRSLVFVAFSGEEAGRLGSRHFLRHSRRFAADRLLAMINLDTVGRLGANPLGVFGTASAREWPHVFRGVEFVTGVPIQALETDLGASDQTSFLEAGVPAVQLFAGVHGDYHRPTDTADKIDGEGLVKVASVTKEVLEYLAGRAEPLTASPAGSSAPAPGATAPRRVSLGTVPDFAHPGPGVRLAGVTPGTPAAAAGLREGDLILALDGEPLADLKAFAQALRALQPGARIRIDYLRDADRRTAYAEVTAR